MAVVQTGMIRDATDNYPNRFNKREIKLKETIQKDNNVDEDFDSPIVISAANKSTKLLADSTLAAGDELAFMTRKSVFDLHVQSVNGTVVNTFPYVSASGLELATDADATNGVLGWELTNGILSTSNAAYTIGSFGFNGKIFAEATITIDDVSDSTSMGFGWRKVEAYQAAIASYTDFAVITKDGSENIDIDHDLNDSGTATSTDTGLNWADGESYELRIEVNQDGVCKFFIDDTEYASSTGFTFDSGDTIIPFLHMVNETGDAGVSISNWRVGRF